MTILLLLSVLGAAVWLALGLAARLGSGPAESAAAYSRALEALSPQARPQGRRRPLPPRTGRRARRPRR